MKKLSLDKFKILKLSNPSKIIGGNTGEPGETSHTKPGWKCEDESENWVYVGI